MQSIANHRKHIIIIVFVLEFTACLFLLSSYFLAKRGAPDSLDTGITVSDFSSNYITFNNGWHIDSSVYNGSTDVIEALYGPFLSLSEGEYTAVIGYDCDYDQDFRPYASGDNLDYIKANTVTMSHYLNECSYNLKIVKPIDNFELRFYFDGQGYLDVNYIKLYKNLNPIK